MSADIRLYESFLNHRKRRKLEKRLGPQGVVSLIDLWLNVAVSRPKGVLEDMSEQDIALDAQWPGDPKEFCQALIEIGFLHCEDGIYFCHEWGDHQPYAYYSKERSQQAREAAETRWKRKHPRKKQGGAIDD